MPDTDISNRPECFARLEKVFPPDKEGVRTVPQTCWGCPERVACLREAVGTGQGKSTIQEELAVRRDKTRGKVGGFLSRWSRLKTNSRQGE